VSADGLRDRWDTEAGDGMKRVTVRPNQYVPKGQVFLMADTGHPEIDPLTPIDDADALIIACHPDNERVLLDAIAIEQERPKWWRDQQALERVLSMLCAEDDA
jgi:hypothetical protein